MVTAMPKESAYFTLHAVDGKRDVKELKQELDSFAGVISVSVNSEKNSVAVDFDNTGVKPEQLKKKIRQLGYDIQQTKSEEHIM